MMSTYCKRCGVMIESDLAIDGYGVRCRCAGDAYRILLQINKRLVEDGEILAHELKVQDKINKINSNEFDGSSIFVDNALAQHTRLMKEMEDK